MRKQWSTFFTLACAVTTVFTSQHLLRSAPAKPSSSNILIAEESFAYPDGVAIKGANGGSGWSGAWETSPLAAGDNHIGSGNISFSGLKRKGNRLVEIGGDVRSFRRVDTSRTELGPLLAGGKFGKPGTTVWVAFLAALSAGENTNKGSGGVHLYNGLGDLSADPAGDKKGHQVVFLGDRNSATTWCIERTTGGAPGGSNHDSTIDVDTTPRLLVYRIDFGAATATIRMFIDPQPGADPKDGTAALTAEVSPFYFDTVEVGSATSPGRGPQEHMDIDELRIGTSFRAVAPTGK